MNFAISIKYLNHAASKNLARHVAQRAVSQWTGKEDMKDVDPELYSIIKHEKIRQKSGLELIASENFTSRSVLQSLGSCLTNKYAEGYPGARYYGGNIFTDKVENLARDRLLKAYRLSPDEWGVNVQPYSGSPGNFAVYTGLLNPHDRIMGLDLPDGGHLTHGFMTATKRVSATSVYFESMPYKLDPSNGYINYDVLEQQANMFRPRLLIAGTTAYSRLLDYARFQKIADQVGAILHADMAHISGLVAAGVVPSPFEYCDVVSSTTHKSLRGPRSGIIFYRLKPRKTGVNAKTGEPTVNPLAVGLKSKIDGAVFPALQGGPHMNAIGAIATMALQAQSPEFKSYSEQVLKNSKAFAEALKKHGFIVVSGGTDTHMFVVDLKNKGLDGSRMERVCELASITLNKNTVPGDLSAFNPGGLRLGSPAMTTRGFKEADFEKVAELMVKALEPAQEAASRTNTLQEFKTLLLEDADLQSKITKLREEVEEFALKFPMPGFEDW